MRPGDSILYDLAIGVIIYIGTAPSVKIYYPDGALATSIAVIKINGTINDLSFDSANGKI